MESDVAASLTATITEFDMDLYEVVCNFFPDHQIVQNSNRAFHIALDYIRKRWVH